MTSISKEDAFNAANHSVERKLKLDGSENPKYVDLLEEDKPIAGQKFTCVSFISPEEIIQQKEHYYFEKYIEQWDMAKSVEKFTQFMHFVSTKYNDKFDTLYSDLEDFCKEERTNIFKTNMKDDYKNFLDKTEEKLEEEFNKLNNFQTNVRGFKIRGCYSSQEEAEMRCKLLREADPNHDVFVGPVGTWIPFHPDAYKTGRVEYLEETLNQLMKEKNSNEQSAKAEFDKYVRDNKEKAIAKNKKNEENKDDENIVTIEGTATTDAVTSETSTISEVRKELFESDNIVIKKIDPVSTPEKSDTN